MLKNSKRNDEYIYETNKRRRKKESEDDSNTLLPI